MTTAKHYIVAAIALTATISLASIAIAPKKLNADILIHSGQVFTGETSNLQSLDVAVCGDKICGVFPAGARKVNAQKRIDATGLIVSPGFIDPHTHTMAELRSADKNNNVNYLTQGVTTVVNGNDGGGDFQIKALTEQLNENGIGTNTALLVGHGSLREQVMGREQRHANAKEIAAMQALLAQGMQDGAFGLSSGLYYVPQSYAATEEVIALAKTAAQFGGVYDTHLRDESTFNIGLINAVQEAIDIARAANIHLHIAHIKALGVDVWGQSKQVSELVEKYQQQGVSISADQYPWLASGTMLRSAVMPKWVMADSKKSFHQRLNDTALNERLDKEITENIRRRGGPSSLLITAFNDEKLVGKTLEEVAKQRQLSPVETAKTLVQEGTVRVASFNMSEQDVKYFMTKPWVMTSSDGTNGHPRKYASFPQKFQQYVAKDPVLSVPEFLYRSSTATAKMLGIVDRGTLTENKVADIVLIDSKSYQAKADFSHWNRLSTGVQWVVVNGQVVIEQGQYNGKLAGKVLLRN